MLRIRTPVKNAAALRRISSTAVSATRFQHLRIGHPSQARLNFRNPIRHLAISVQPTLNGMHQLPPSMTACNETFDTRNFELLQRVKVDYADIEASSRMRVRGT